MMNNSLARFALGVAALAALAGCGGGGGADAAPPPPAPAPAPAPAPTPVKVQALQPADGSTKVDIRPTLQVVLDGPIDASSVTSAHVQLLSTGYPQLATLSYDAASHTIAIVPGTLAHDTRYTLAVSGLVDSHGNTVAASQATFSTWVNAEIAGHATDGSFNYTYTLNASGRPTLGPNLTANGYQIFNYLPNGRLSETEVWEVGPDQQPNTADDVLDYTITFEYEQNGALHTDTSHYPSNGGQLTRDIVDTYSYDANGRQSGYVAATTFGSSPPSFSYYETIYDDKGIDVRKMGARDSSFAPSTLYSFSVRTPASGSTPERLSYYSGVGADGLPFTDDDVLSNYVEITRDSRGNMVREVDYSLAYNAAPSAPPSIDGYVSYTYDAHDNLVQEITYGGPGPDGIWFTGDDAVYAVYDYDTTH